MDLPWGDERTRKLVTNVGLITSDGPHGPNIMACEWTYQLSYRPGLFGISLGEGKATLDNIRKTKEFGVNIAATDQQTLSSIAGGYTGKETDKVQALKELGHVFYPGTVISVPLIKGAAMNAECRLVSETPFGDHVLLVGEVVAATTSDKEPLVLHGGAYWKLTTPLTKTSETERERIQAVLGKFQK